jgi:hypothetical protein
MFIKDPEAVLDYHVDWSRWLPDGDTLTHVEFTPYAPLPLSGAYVPPPTGVTATAETVAGALPAGTYYYVVTAVSAGGESTASEEVSATVSGSTASVTVSWEFVAGATSYNIYRSDQPGQEQYLVGSVDATQRSWADVGDLILSRLERTPPLPIIVSPDHASSVTDTIATVWLARGVAGYEFRFDCLITTTDGRKDSRMLTFQIVDK